MCFRESSIEEDEESLISHLPAYTGTTLPRLNIDLEARCKKVLRALLNFLWQSVLFAIPSFCKRPVGKAHMSSEKVVQPLSTSAEYHSTEYLDGIRGLASFIVFVDHWTSMTYAAATRTAVYRLCGNCQSSESSTLVPQWSQYSSSYRDSSSRTNSSTECTAMSMRSSSLIYLP